MAYERGLYNFFKSFLLLSIPFVQRPSIGATDDKDAATV